jgi:hypothetical protein
VWCGPGSRLRLASVAGELAINEIYRKVSSLDQLPVGVSTPLSYLLGECHQFVERLRIPAQHADEQRDNDTEQRRSAVPGDHERQEFHQGPSGRRRIGVEVRHRQ